MKAPEHFGLTPSDKDSPTWARLKRHMQQRIDALHRELETDLDPVATAKLRGRITELKGLLSLDAEKNLPPGL